MQIIDLSRASIFLYGIFQTNNPDLEMQLISDQEERYDSIREFINEDVGVSFRQVKFFEDLTTNINRAINDKRKNIKRGGFKRDGIHNRAHEDKRRFAKGEIQVIERLKRLNCNGKGIIRILKGEGRIINEQYNSELNDELCCVFKELRVGEKINGSCRNKYLDSLEGLFLVSLDNDSPIIITDNEDTRRIVYKIRDSGRDIFVRSL